MQPTKMEHYYVRATVFILVFILVRVSALKTTNLNSNATFQSVVSTADDDTTSSITGLDISRQNDNFRNNFKHNKGLPSMSQNPSDSHSGLTEDISYPLESVPSTASQKILTHDHTSEGDPSLEVASIDVTQARDSAEDVAEESTLSDISPGMPVQVSNTYKGLVREEDDAGIKCQSIHNDRFNGTAFLHYPNNLTLLSENGSEKTSDKLVGTYTENNSDIRTDIYDISTQVSDKQAAKITTRNLSHNLELSAKQGEYITVRDQLTNHSTEQYNAYPSVATEDAYIILQDFIGSPTDHPATQSNLLFINSSEISDVRSVTEKSEGQCTDSCRNSTENVYEKSEMPTKVLSNTSADKQPERGKEQLISNLNEGARPGRWISTRATSSRRPRDHWAVTERLLGASKGKSPTNVGDIAQFTTSTTDSSLLTSSGQLRKSATKFPNASSGTTETASRYQGGQLISISVENPSRYSSSSNSTRRFDTILRTTTGRSSSGSLKTFPPVDALHFIPLEHEPRIYLAAPSGVQVARVTAVDYLHPEYAVRYSLDPAKRDSQFFQIHAESGNITTKRYISKTSGEFYNLTVVATSSRDVTATMDIIIRVAEYNRYPPKFETANYTVELDVLTQVPTEFLTVKAVDNDTHQYNSEVYYSVTTQDFVTVNPTTGVVTLRKRLSGMYKQLSFTISARDGGSPERTSRTKLTIIIKILSAPREVTVAGIGDTWCMLCWKIPLSGHSLGYLIWLHSNTTPVFRNVSVDNLGKKNSMLCTAVSDLRRWTDYSFEVAGWNKDEVGITSAPVPFNTRVNRSCNSINSTDYTCSCLMGYYGDGCAFFNPCNSTEPPCQNGGLCKSNESNVFTCDCPEGYYGSSCEHFNPCSRSPCQHNSTCSNITSSKYKCRCKPGYTGNMCEININECDPSPCQNIATCIDGLNNFTCVCASGFEGDLCQYNIDECKDDPCQNGGICFDEIGSYYCKCPPGYEGVHCETNTDDCQSNQCENNGTCVDGLEDYYCNCQAGFEGDYCEDEINECMARPCLNGGTCTDAFNDFSCDCPPGYSGKRCEWDVDLCQSQPCQNNGECIDLIDHIECECPRGYHGLFCEMKVLCPGEFSKTDRGKFFWEPLAHGEISTLPCPYGMSTTYTEHLEQMAHDSALELGYFPFHNPIVPTKPDAKLRYPDLNENMESARLFKNPNLGYEDRARHSAVGLKTDPVKLHAHLKDIEYKRAHEINADNHDREKEVKLRTDEEGQPFAVRSCIILRDGSVKWSKMDDSICRDEQSTNAEQMSSDLEKLTKDPALINAEVFINASIQIKKILNYALSNRKIAQSMFSVISNLMAVNDVVLEEADKYGSITKDLIQVIDTYASAAKLPPNGTIAIDSENLALESRELYPAEFTILADGMSYPPPGIKNIGFFSDVGDVIQEIFITVPREALERALRQSRSARVQFVSYKNSKFFRSDNYSSSSVMSLSTEQRVISAALSNITISNLTELLVYNFRNTNGNEKQICVYWNMESQEWLDDGISTNQSMDWIQCESTHLTAFSVLLDPNTGVPIPVGHEQALSIITYIGSVCSIFGLFLTILTYSLFRCLNRDRSGKILLNLCISLLLMNLAFLLVALQEYMDRSLMIVVDVCTGVAVLTHYLVLTSLMWMLVEAINMYQLLITVFATSETKFMCKRMLCAWGIPLLIVGGTAIYDLQYYSAADSEYCVVSPSEPVLYYVTYLGPSCLILAVNLIVFVLVSKVLFQRRHSHAIGKVAINADSPTITVAQIRGAFTVMTLLGVTWVFGPLAVGDARLVFQYIFCIANSLQGFLIFLVRCVQYPEARMAWLTFLHTGKLKKHRGPQGHVLPSSSAGNSHSRHTVSSSTQSQSQLQGLDHLTSQSHSHVHSRHRSSHATSTRKTSLPESSSCMSNSSGSGHSSMWSRVFQHDPYHKTHDHVYSKSRFRNLFGSAHVPDYKQKTDFNSQQEAEKGEIQRQDMIDGGYDHTNPLSNPLTKELRQKLEGRTSTLPLSRTQSMHIQHVYCDPVVPEASEVDGSTANLKRGGSMRCRVSQHQQKQTGSSHQSLTTKEGEDTSWQFLRAPPDGMSESKAVAVAENYTTSHNHSDQGYMSGACTAEHSPESPRQEPKRALSGTIPSPVQSDACHNDQRLTVSTPDHLYPDPSEEAMDGRHNDMLTKSDSDITVMLPKPVGFLQVDQDGKKGPATYVAIKGEMVYNSSPLTHPDLVYENNTVSSSIQQSGTGSGLIMASGLYHGGTNRETRELCCMDHPPQPQSGYNFRRTCSTKSYSSSEGNNGDSSSSVSIQSESNSLEMEPQTIQLSARHQPVHLRHHTKRIRCEEVL